MFSAIRNFFTPPLFEGDIQKSQDAKIAHQVAVALFAIGFFSFPFIYQLQPPTREIALYSTIGGLFIWLGCVWLIKKDRIGLAKLILIGLNTINIYAVIILNGGFSRPIIIVTFLLQALSVLLYPIRGARYFGALNILVGSTIFLLGRIGVIPQASSTGNDLEIFLLFIFTALASTVVLEISSVNNRLLIDRILDREKELSDKNISLDTLRNQLEMIVEERTASLEKTSSSLQRRANQLQTVTEIARSISMVQDISKLLPSITQAISRGFGYYHVGIFLLDRRAEYAELRAANSEGGQRMLDRHHRLRVGEEGIIGYVTRFGRARIALDVGEDAVFFDNPDLPETRSEIGLPLIVGGEIIGALDVQSKEARAFSPEDISALGALANQVSIAIQNANLFMQSQQAVADTERAYREFIREEWVKIAPLLRQKGYSFSAAGTLPLTSATQYDKEQGVFLVPISLRGENIGELGIRAPDKDARPSPEEIAILRATADRVALALENARLFQDAQLRAWTERAISDMSSKIASSVDIDAILQSTVQELSQLVGESEVVIQIGMQRTGNG